MQSATAEFAATSTTLFESPLLRGSQQPFAAASISLQVGMDVVAPRRVTEIPAAVVATDMASTGESGAASRLVMPATRGTRRIRLPRSSAGNRPRDTGFDQAPHRCCRWRAQGRRDPWGAQRRLDQRPDHRQPYGRTAGLSKLPRVVGARPSSSELSAIFRSPIRRRVAGGCQTGAREVECGTTGSAIY